MAEERKSFVALPLTGADRGRRVRGVPRTSSTGAADGEVVGLTTLGSVVAISPTLLPPGVGPTIIPGVKVAASETGMLAGAWVTLIDNVGVAEVWRAIAGPTPRPVHGFIKEDPVEAPPGTWTVDVYTDGVNDQIPVGAWAAADVGNRVFISKMAEKMTDDVSAFVAGDLVQALGYVLAVGATEVSVDFMPGDELYLE